MLVKGTSSLTLWGAVLTATVTHWGSKPQNFGNECKYEIQFKNAHI